MSKMGLYDPFRYLKHKLWPKKKKFDSRALKFENHPDLLVWKWCTKYHWTTLDKVYNFALNVTPIRGLHKKLWTSKVAGILILEILKLSTWESWNKMTFGCTPHGKA
jgi:hypothetical protein